MEKKPTALTRGMNVILF